MKNFLMQLGEGLLLKEKGRDRRPLYFCNEGREYMEKVNFTKRFFIYSRKYSLEISTYICAENIFPYTRETISSSFFHIVTIYSKSTCPYCILAKNILNNLNIPFKEIDITRSPEIMEELIKKSHMMTVPQIFVGEKCLGGYDSINALHQMRVARIM